MPSQPKSALRTRQQDRARQQRQDAKARRACVDAVWAREAAGIEGSGGQQYGICQVCHDTVQRYGAFSHLLGHVHETRARSLGGDPTDPNGCELVCAQCHAPGPSGAHRRSVRASQ